MLLSIWDILGFIVLVVPLIIVLIGLVYVGIENERIAWRRRSKALKQDIEIDNHSNKYQSPDTEIHQDLEGIRNQQDVGRLESMDRPFVDELQSVAETTARGSFYLFIGNFISEILNAVTIIFVANLLTPEEMGIYSLSFVLPGIFMIFSNLGLSEALTRFIARFQSRGEWGDVKRVTWTGFLFQGGSSFLLAAVMFVTADFLAVYVMRRPELTGFLKIMSILIITQAIFTMATAVFYGLERMDLSGAMKVVFSFVKCVSAYVLVIRGYGVNGAIYGHILGTSAASIISVLLIGYVLRGKEAQASSQSSENNLPEMLKFGFPLFLTTFLGTLDSSYRGILLAWFTDNVTIGNLDVAIKFLSLVSLLTLPIVTVIYPAFSKFTYRRQPEEMKALYRTSVRYSTLFIIPAVMGIIVLSGQGIGFLFGSRYELASRFLSLALLPYLAVGLGSLSVFGFLNSQGDTTTTFRLNAITVGLRLILGTLLIWQWGVPGLLVGYFVSNMSGNLLNLYAVRRKYGVDVDLAHTARVGIFSALAAIITSQALLLIPTLGYLLQGVVGGIVFFVACMFLAPLSRAFVVSDIVKLRRIFKKERVISLVLAPFLNFEERIIKIIPWD